MSDSIVLAGSKTQTNFYISIKDNLDLLDVVDNPVESEESLGYLKEITIHLRILRSNLPQLKVFIFAEPDFIGILRKSLMRNRVAFDRVSLCDLEKLSVLNLKEKIASLDNAKVVSIS